MQLKSKPQYLRAVLLGVRRCFVTRHRFVPLTSVIMSSLHCVTAAVLHPPAVNTVEVRLSKYKYVMRLLRAPHVILTCWVRERPTTYVADLSYAQHPSTGTPDKSAGSADRATGVQRSPSLPQFSARYSYYAATRF